MQFPYLNTCARLMICDFVLGVSDHASVSESDRANVDRAAQVAVENLSQFFSPARIKATERWLRKQYNEQPEDLLAMTIGDDITSEGGMGVTYEYDDFIVTVPYRHNELLMELGELVGANN